MAKLNFAELGRNVDIASDGDYVYLRMKVNEQVVDNAPISNSGKSIVIASTGGNVRVDTKVGTVSIGVNAYTKYGQRAGNVVSL